MKACACYFLCWVIYFTPALQAAQSAEAAISLDTYTVEYVRQQVPKQRHGDDVRLIRLDQLYTFSAENYYELISTLQAQGKHAPVEVIVLANGTYSLADVVKLIHNDTLIRRVNADTYISYRPIYIAPTASLILQNLTLRLSVPDIALLAYNGNLFVTDATITSWDEARKDYSPRPPTPKDQLLQFGKRDARPYLLGRNGSSTYIANTHIVGLGYNSTSAFGLSLSAPALKSLRLSSSLKGALRALPRPRGLFVGNHIERCFFGFYTNNADKVHLIGNIFHHNIIYNIDPHDYTDHLTIARNITYAAKHAHGIILSREIKQASVTENLSFANAGTGIMFDRNIQASTIQANMVFDNQGDGIAIFESDDNRIIDNTVFMNRNNGLFVRNSLGTQAQHNQFVRNGHFGVETAVTNIDATLTRDFQHDPYHKASMLYLTDNQVTANVSAAISVKSQASLYLKGNTLTGSGSAVFAGVLSAFAHRLLRGNQTGIYHCAKNTACEVAHHSPTPPTQATLNKSQQRRRLIQQYKQQVLDSLREDGIISAYNAKARIALTTTASRSKLLEINQQLQPGVCAGHLKAMYLSAHLRLNQQAYAGHDTLEALTLVAISAFLEYPQAAMDLTLIPLLTAISKQQIVQSVNLAIQRLARGVILGPQALAECDAGEYKANIPAATVHRVKRLQANPPLQHPRDVAALFSAQVARYHAFGPAGLAHYFQEQTEVNQPKKARAAQEKANRKQQAMATGKTRAYLDRKNKRETSAAKFLHSTRTQTLKQFSPQLQNLLTTINQHRAANAHVSLPQILRWAAKGAK